MGNHNSTIKTDLVLSIVLLGISALVYWETLGLPESPYEPMGPAFVPKVLSVIIGALALLLLAKSLRDRLKGAVAIASAPEEPFQTDYWVKQPLMAVAGMVLTVAYIASMHSGLLGFRAATISFIMLSGSLLTKMKMRLIPIFILIACIMGLGGHYIFTKVFVVDLP